MSFIPNSGTKGQIVTHSIDFEEFPCRSNGVVQMIMTVICAGYLKLGSVMLRN